MREEGKGRREREGDGVQSGGYLCVGGWRRVRQNGRWASILEEGEKGDEGSRRRKAGR